MRPSPGLYRPFIAGPASNESQGPNDKPRAVLRAIDVPADGALEFDGNPTGGLSARAEDVRVDRALAH